METSKHVPRRLLSVTESACEIIVAALDVAYSEGLLPHGAEGILLQIGAQWPHLFKHDLAITQVFNNVKQMCDLFEDNE